MTRTTMLILGASGDLTRRMLLPGIASLLVGGTPADAELVDGLTIIGSGRSAHPTDEWRETVRSSFRDAGATGDAADRIVGSSDYLQADPSQTDDWRRLLERVGRDDLVVYFALPPAVVEKVVDALQDLDLPERTVLALEKPFGEDADDAEHLNERLATLVPERRIHRVDHFLGQRAVLALLTLRADNRLLEAAWSAEHVERVEIVYDEQLGLEGRAGYYDSSGALKDMLQSHLLQVLAFVAMEPPATVGADDLRDAIAIALRATAVWSQGPVFPNTAEPSRRARYTAGRIGDHDLPAYVDEDGVEPSNDTETLAEIALEVRTARWAGVPFLLRSGKAVAEPTEAIVLTMRPVRHRPGGQEGEGQRERIMLAFKPVHLSVALTAAGGSQPFRLEPVDLAGDLPRSAVTAYGEVVRGVLGDHPTLSVRGDVAARCWRIVQPVLDAWRRGDVPLEEYAAGSAGPASWAG